MNLNKIKKNSTSEIKEKLKQSKFEVLTNEKDFLVKWTSGGELKIKTHKDERGKFGRILGEIWTFDTNINDKMVYEHHAVPYHGQSKEEMEEQHLANREKVKL